LNALRASASVGATPQPARAGLSIRTRALLVSLVLLAIPFVGYGYVREIERVLQAAQEQTVIATARAVATALHDRPKLLERRIDAEASAAVYPRGTTVAATQEIELIIRGLRRSGSRIWVIDQDRRLLLLEGSLRPDPRPAVEPDLWDRIQNAVLGPLFALLLERPREDFEDALPEDVLSGGRAVDNALTGVPATRWRETADKRAVILAAAHPIWNGTEVIGAVVVEESTNRVLSLRNRAFEQLLTTTVAVFVLGALVLFLFATRLSRRLSRLRDEAEHAIDARGRVHRAFRAERDRDEIGDLSRSFGTVLDRLAEYNDYLERMADRLSHELRTPIAVVSSSLDNLRTAPGGAGSQVYIQRAEEGVRRLNAILTRMSEARRLAETLKGTERERFDLARIVSGCVAGYAATFPHDRFDLRLPQHPVELDGAPDLIAQLLDKLVDNAREFSAPGEPIEIVVDVEWDWARIAVSNVGPPLPDAMAGQIFESMVSVRPAAAPAPERPRTEPHLGLGLFIVRLIAEFHGGRAAARNRPDGRGVTVEVAFPLAGGRAGV
jgi:two-component system, OmpR family, sensor histidine kinase ChvG